MSPQPTSTKDLLQPFFRNADIQCLLKEFIRPISVLIYDQLYFYIWFICLYHIILIFLVLVILILLFQREHRVFHLLV